LGKDAILVYSFGFRMKIKKIMMIFFHFEIIFIEKLLIQKDMMIFLKHLDMIKTGKNSICNGTFFFLWIIKHNKQCLI